MNNFLGSLRSPKQAPLNIFSLLSHVRPYQLYGYHEDGLEGEGAVTEVKQVL